MAAHELIRESWVAVAEQLRRAYADELGRLAEIEAAWRTCQSVGGIPADAILAPFSPLPPAK